ncbi:50S ribosomal protein L4 [Blattabacterium cuenoti]|uniref:50S ribosomal protein L4 n=1 Tax=Blattabacterium cuenoti TaxID=1653831 RepID=UPI00163C399B|nr:50S ribosomal protein L4 [Blattabacterium cuenoti]
MELEILDIKGELTNRKIVLNDNFFEKTKPYNHSIYLEIKRYLSAQRHGKHKSKERSDLSGSTKKLHRQKGTGASRKGDIKNPIFRGGGRVFGPRPRLYLSKMNKQTKFLVRKSIIEYKLKKNKVKIIEDIRLDKPKMKPFLKILEYLGLINEKLLMIVEKKNTNLYLSSRNLDKFRLSTICEVNSYLLLKYSYILFSESSAKKIKNFLDPLNL